MIKFPLRVEQNPGARFAHIVDADGRVITGGATFDDAQQLVAAANAGTQLQHSQRLEKPARQKNKREQLADKLRESDPLAIIMERDDEIVYGHYDELPQAGESVARLKR